MFDKVEEVLSAQWLIHQDTALKFIPYILSFLQRGELSSNIFITDQAKHKPYVIASSINTVDRFELTDTNIPENSIAVIPIMGVIMKYGYSGTMSLMNRIREAENNPKIGSLFFWFETPGGMVNNTDLAAEAIAQCEKPTVGFVSSMCASAGMWLISGCNKIIASSKLDMIGSIGVKTNIMDINSFLRDKLGIFIKDVYATLSVKKDYEYRQLVDENNEEPIKARLDYINNIFHASISKNMGIAAGSEVFSADVYYAEDAIRVGLCHEIGTLQYALKTAHDLGLAYNYVKS